MAMRRRVAVRRPGGTYIQEPTVMHNMYAETSTMYAATGHRIQVNTCLGFSEVKLVGVYPVTQRFGARIMPPPPGSGS